MKLKITVLSLLFIVSSFAQPNNNFLTLDYVDDYVFIPNDSSSYINNQITFEAWYNTVDGITLQPILEYFEGIHYWINVSSFPGSGANLVDLNFGYHKIAFTPDGDPNTWNHMALTYDGFTGEALVYSNGVLKNSVDLGIFTPKASGNLYIGHRSSFLGGPQYYFNGSLSEIRMWNVVRSEAQIQETMNTLLTPEYYQTADSGLVGYWRLDQFEDLGVGGDGIDDLRDLSYKQNHGDSYGTPSIVTDINDNQISSPNNYLLSQNFPNPFNPSTFISYQLPVSGKAELKIFDLLGNEVAILVDEYKPAGNYQVEFSATGGQSSGIYFYQLNSGSFVETKKMILLK